MTAPPSNQGRLLQYLPELYQEHEAVSVFLAALESILFGGADGIDGVADILDHRLPALFDPERTTELEWLAGWVGLAFDEGVPEPTRRVMLKHAVGIYQRRGTARGLQEVLDLIADGKAVVTEPETTGFRVGAAIVGQTTVIGRERPHYFEVQIVDTAVGAAAERLIRRVVGRMKPAHTHYELRAVTAATAAASRRSLAESFLPGAG